MLRVIFISFIVLGSVAIADVSLGVSVSSGEETVSTIKNRDSSSSNRTKKKVKETKKFRKDDHRYNKNYKDFNYELHGYYNIDGLYFGFFDRRGYFFNNIYFEYNSQYTYNDRLNRRGYFDPYRHHYRRYRHYRDNDWNRVHHYREPNEIVRGYYYEESYRPRDRRGGYVRESYVIERGVDSRRDYINRDRGYYRNDRDFFIDEIFYDERRREIERGYRRPRDSGHISYHRFSGKKHKGSITIKRGH